MKAIRLVERGAGGVRLADVPDPAQAPGMVRVRLLAASVNRVDLYMRESGEGITHQLPITMGVDGVGELIDEAPVAGLAKGQRVMLYPYEFCGRCRYCLAGDQPLCKRARIFGEHRDGTFTEVISVPVSSVLPLSGEPGVVEAAALGVAYLTAWRMVFGRAPAVPGSIVLVQGAGGGVSYAAAQLARMAGARVLVTTRGDRKLEHFRDLGYEVIDYGVADVPRTVLDMTAGEGADLVIDNSCERSWPGSLRSLARGGHLVTCGATTGGHPSAELQRLFIRQLTVHGSTMGSLEEFRQLVRCFEAGLIHPHIDSVFPLAETALALERLSDPDRLGKVIIDIAAGGR